MPKIHLLKLEKMPIKEQLKVEEALLRTDNRNWCLINHGSPPAIVLGISGKVEELVYDDQPLPLIRRYSGGGTVVIDEDTCFFTLICNSDEIGIEPYPRPILSWCGRHFEPLFPPGMFHVNENDYTLRDKKFGGNAQYIAKRRWVHHTSVLWNYDRQKMGYLKMPPKIPDYRKKRSHNDFLITISPFFSSKEALFDDFLNSLKQKIEIVPTHTSEIAELIQKPHRSSTILLKKSALV